ncbi:MAG: Hsp20/alpha crystallin family protein [Bacillota bacterium]|nr:Hsp20/alpha crystallin family protein [Bacillota bacterium]
MEIDKLKQWLELAQQYQADGFWKQIFDEKQSQTPNQRSTSPIFHTQEPYPKCDLYEWEDCLVLEAELPGMKKEHIHISVSEHTISISGEFLTLETDRKYFLKERLNRKFEKKLSFPLPIVKQNIQSDLNNGIFTLIMPIDREEMEDIPISFGDQTPE